MRKFNVESRVNMLEALTQIVVDLQPIVEETFPGDINRMLEIQERLSTLVRSEAYILFSKIESQCKTWHVSMLLSHRRKEIIDSLVRSLDQRQWMLLTEIITDDGSKPEYPFSLLNKTMLMYHIVVSAHMGKLHNDFVGNAKQFTDRIAKMISQLE